MRLDKFWHVSYVILSENPLFYLLQNWYLSFQAQVDVGSCSFPQSLLIWNCVWKALSSSFRKAKRPWDRHRRVDRKTAWHSAPSSSSTLHCRSCWYYDRLTRTFFCDKKFEARRDTNIHRHHSAITVTIDLLTRRCCISSEWSYTIVKK